MVLNRRRDMMRAFNDREIDTLYVWLGLLAVGVGPAAVWREHGAGIASSVVFAATRVLYPDLGGAVSSPLSPFPTGSKPASASTDAPGIKSIGIIFRTVAGIVLIVLRVDDRNLRSAHDLLDHVLGLLCRLMIANCLPPARHSGARNSEPHRRTSGTRCWPSCDFHRGGGRYLRRAGRSDWRFGAGAEQVRPLHGELRWLADR